MSFFDYSIDMKAFSHVIPYHIYSIAQMETRDLDLPSGVLEKTLMAEETKFRYDLDPIVEELNKLYHKKKTNPMNNVSF